MRYMTAARVHELRLECQEDLELARKLKHKEWAETLAKRLAFLDGLIFAAKNKHKIDKPRT